MTYLRPHNRERTRRNRTIAVIVIVIAAVVGMTQALAPHAFPVFFNAIARPFWREKFAFESGAFRTPSQILAENEELSRQLSDLRMAYASSSIAVMENQNRELLAVFGRASTTPRQFVLGAVLAKPGTLPYDVLIVDVGREDGISTTSLVYAPGRVLIGHIKELYARSAKVVLYSSPRETYSVAIGEKRVPATAVGRGGGQYEAEVPHGSNIQAGETVVTASLYDRAFGVVVSVITDPSNPFDKILVAPPVNIFELRYVLVTR